MKNIPIQLQTLYEQQTRGTCFLIKIVSQDGRQVFAFTSLDSKIKYNDGDHELWYRPTQSLLPQNMQFTSDMEADNTELHGWFNAVVKAAMLSGSLHSAAITILRVAFYHIGAGHEVVGYGRLGKVEYAANKQGKRKIEFMGLDHILEQASNPLYSHTCRWDYGDENCGMPFDWYDGVVTEVAVGYPRTRFKVSGISQADDYFNLGVALFTDGDNEGADPEVDSWTSDGWVFLGWPTAANIEIGAAVRLRVDCDKTPDTCKSKGNILNIGSEHLLPSQEVSIMVPGAYIKSSNAA